MKTQHRTLKIIAVILVVGYGSVHDINFQNMYQQIENEIINYETKNVNANTFKFNGVVAKTVLKQFLINL